MAELWDGRNRDGSLSGVTLVRGEKIPEGQYHLVCEILVRHADGDYLLMRRDERKAAYPGWWEATAGGPALCGEDALGCARRELREETGITRGEMTEIAQDVVRDTIYREFLCVTDWDKEAITLQEGETTAFRWLTEEEFIAFLRSEEAIPTQKERYREYFHNIIGI